MRAALLLGLFGCQFSPGTFTPSGDGGSTTDDGTARDGADPDAMETPRRCTFLLGSDHSCSRRTSDGAIFCVGLNGFGELGRGSQGGAFATTMQVNVAATTSASSRSYHTCVAKQDGTVQCWGFNDSGQIGDNTTTTRPSPTTVMNLANVVEVSVARSFSCARRTNGSVTCWGANGDGQLGDGTNTPHPTPATLVQGLAQAPVELSAGSSHACARFADGTAACWGRNDFGQLGDNSQMDRTSAVAVPLAGIKDLAPSGYSTPGEGVGGQTCAVLSSGALYCWGSNDYGQLGTAAFSTTPSLTPVQVAGITDAVEVTLGRIHTCARHATGNVSCWGRNNVGAVGDGSMTDRSSPTPVSLPRPAVHVAAGGHHTCALLDDDSVRCWGLNTSGQLADTTFTTRTSPVASSLCP